MTGIPHPGNYLLRPEGRVGFLDYGLLRDVSAARAEAERGAAHAVGASDAAALKSALVTGAYLPSDGADHRRRAGAQADAAGDAVVRGPR